MSSSEAPKDASSSTAGQSQLGDVETTYNGNCHCGALQYSIVLPRPLEEKPSQVASCNCSICTRNGYLLVHPKTEAVTFIKGSLEELGCYQFGKKDVKHRFCKTCGSSLFIDGTEKFGVLPTNVRHFRDIDLDKLDFNKYQGKDAEPKYEVSGV